MDLVIEVFLTSIQIFGIYNLISTTILIFLKKHLSQNVVFVLNRMSYVILRTGSALMIVPFTILLFKETITAKEFVANFAGIQFIYLIMSLIWRRTEEK